MGACSGRENKGQKPRRKGKNLPKDYVIDQKPIGKGIFTRVYKCHLESAPNTIYVVKTLNKDLIHNDEIESILDEVERLKLLNHPNVAKYYDIYEDKKNLYVVSDYIEGEPLGHHLSTGKEEYSEMEIASMMQQLFSALSYCHSKGVVHRNIKPENLIVDEAKNLYLIDFGLARLTKSDYAIKKDGEQSQFNAPETNSNTYSDKSDIYSVGNLIYLLFAKKLPFSGGNIIGTFKKIRGREITFKNKCWREVSFEVPILIRKMVEDDPDRRISASEACKDKWLNVVKSRSTDDEECHVNEDVIDALENFHCESIFEKGCMNRLALMLDEEAINDIRDTFNAIDLDHDGVITFEELKRTMRQLYPKYTEADVHELIQEADYSGTKTIDFTEFVAATMDRSQFKNSGLVKELFVMLDKNKDGKISPSDIHKEFKNFTKVITILDFSSLT